MGLPALFMAFTYAVSWVLGILPCVAMSADFSGQSLLLWLASPQNQQAQSFQAGPDPEIRLRVMRPVGCCRLGRDGPVGGPVCLVGGLVDFWI